MSQQGYRSINKIQIECGEEKKKKNIENSMRDMGRG